mgnify:CR=1 FL=1
MRWLPSRFRLPKDIVIDPKLPKLVQMMMVAARDYGIVVMDRSGPAPAFCVEDMTQYVLKQLPAGIDDTREWTIEALKPYMDGATYGWEFMEDFFPWDKLQALA